MPAKPNTPHASEAAPEAPRSSGYTNPSITYHAPLQNDATPAATATCTGRLPHGCRCRSMCRSGRCGGGDADKEEEDEEEEEEDDDDDDEEEEEDDDEKEEDDDDDDG